jgi:hypothetical protein
MAVVHSVRAERADRQLTVCWPSALRRDFIADWLPVASLRIALR